MRCTKCNSGAEMRKGVALDQTYTGIGDFHDGDAVSTISPGGSGRLVTVKKCPECGHSVANTWRNMHDD